MTKKLQYISEYSQNSLQGKRVLVRLDLNMPIANGSVVDEYRLKASIPTLNLLQEYGAKIIIIAHIENKKTDSLRTVLPVIKKYFKNIYFCEDIFSDQTKAIVKNLEDGHIALFENLRKWEGEKKNDIQFAQRLAQYADLYVNDAFSVCHREHASIVGIQKYIPGYAGINIQKEIEALSKTFNPKHPFLFIIGGAKFETKLPLLQKFTNVADTVYVGGALANDIYKSRGLNVGSSLVSDIDVTKIANKKNVRVPEVVIVQRGDDALTVSLDSKDAIQEGDIIYDADPQSIALLKEIITSAHTIVWNGPLGDYEHNFISGTQALAQVIAESDAYSIVGGGDTLASIQDMNLENSFDFISTGGGAMLDFLVNETLPGIDVLKNAS